MSFPFKKGKRKRDDDDDRPDNNPDLHDFFNTTELDLSGVDDGIRLPFRNRPFQIQNRNDENVTTSAINRNVPFEHAYRFTRRPGQARDLFEVNTRYSHRFGDPGVQQNDTNSRILEGQYAERMIDRILEYNRARQILREDHPNATGNPDIGQEAWFPYIRHPNAYLVPIEGTRYLMPFRKAGSQYNTTPRETTIGFRRKPYTPVIDRIYKYRKIEKGKPIPPFQYYPTDDKFGGRDPRFINIRGSTAQHDFLDQFRPSNVTYNVFRRRKVGGKWYNWFTQVKKSQGLSWQDAKDRQKIKKKYEKYLGPPTNVTKEYKPFWDDKGPGGGPDGPPWGLQFDPVPVSGRR